MGNSSYKKVAMPDVLRHHSFLTPSDLFNIIVHVTELYTDMYFMPDEDEETDDVFGDIVSNGYTVIMLHKFSNTFDIMYFIQLVDYYVVIVSGKTSAYACVLYTKAWQKNLVSPNIENELRGLVHALITPEQLSGDHSTDFFINIFPLYTQDDLVEILSGEILNTIEENQEIYEVKPLKTLERPLPKFNDPNLN